MDEIAIAIKLQETTDRSLRNEGRIKKLEGEQMFLEFCGQDKEVPG